MDAFPSIERHPGSAARIDGARITLSYLTSRGEPRTETLPLLSPDAIVRLVQARMDRFAHASPAARESEQSRHDRKYIAAHPDAVLHAAFGKMSDMQRMELTMMLDRRSHGGNSSPAWLAAHARPARNVVGDDGRPLDTQEPTNHSDNQMAYLSGSDRKAMPRSDFAMPGSKRFPVNDPTHARLAISGATRSEHAGNISASTAEKIKSAARAKLGNDGDADDHPRHHSLTIASANHLHSAGHITAEHRDRIHAHAKGKLAAHKRKPAVSARDEFGSLAPKPAGHYMSTLGAGREDQY